MSTVFNKKSICSTDNGSAPRPGGNNAPIGVFDSGVGGLTVLCELVRLMPNEDFIYFGDEANAPYGALTHDEIRATALAALDRLSSFGIKALAVACNTATAAAIDTLRAARTDMPIIGTEPAVKVAHDTGCRHILVLATPVTVAEPRFETLVETQCGDAEVIALPCPRLATLIEENDAASPIFDSYLREILSPYAGRFDSIVLGCTHYPLIKGRITAVASEYSGGRELPMFDSAAAIARQTLRRLSEAGITADADRRGQVSCLSSGEDGGRRIEEIWRRIAPNATERA